LKNPGGPPFPRRGATKKKTPIASRFRAPRHHFFGRAISWGGGISQGPGTQGNLDFAGGAPTKTPGGGKKTGDGGGGGGPPFWCPTPNTKIWERGDPG